MVANLGKSKDGHHFSQKVLESPEKAPQGQPNLNQGSLSSWNEPKKPKDYETITKDDDLTSGGAILPPAYTSRDRDLAVTNG
jgi:hypothetical protein